MSYEPSHEIYRLFITLRWLIKPPNLRNPIPEEGEDTSSAPRQELDQSAAHHDGVGFELSFWILAAVFCSTTRGFGRERLRSPLYRAFAGQSFTHPPHPTRTGTPA